MKLFHTIHRLKWFFLAVPRMDISFRLPKSCNIIIFNSFGATHIRRALDDRPVVIFDELGKSLNIPILVWTLLDMRNWKKRRSDVYMTKFFHKVHPKIIITFVDENLRFWEISQKYDFAKTIMIQNGRRSETEEVFGSISNRKGNGELPHWRVDYIFCFNPSIGRKYAEFLGGEIKPIGSFKNNSLLKVAGEIIYEILFISEWEPENEIGIYKKIDGTFFKWEEFIKTDIHILQFLDSYCFENKIKLNIAGRKGIGQDQEIRFFEANLNKCEWNYLPRINDLSVYEYISKSDTVISISSTCGYEAFGRGKKTVFFAIRNKFSKLESEKFGWPETLPDEGPFWSDSLNFQNLSIVLNYVRGLEVDKWEKIFDEYHEKLMMFDAGNSKFKSIVQASLNNL